MKAVEPVLTLDPNPISPKSANESKTDSPLSGGSVKDRMSAYQEAAAGKVSPKSPVTGGSSLKERLAAYQETVLASNVKKQVDISPPEHGLSQRLSTYMEATTSAKMADADDEGFEAEGE